METMWRMVWVLATLRDQLLDAGREGDLDELVAEAREVMLETMTEGPTGNPLLQLDGNAGL